MVETRSSPRKRKAPEPSAPSPKKRVMKQTNVSMPPPPDKQRKSKNAKPKSAVPTAERPTVNKGRANGGTGTPSTFLEQPSTNLAAQATPLEHPSGFGTQTAPLIPPSYDPAVVGPPTGSFQPPAGHSALPPGMHYSPYQQPVGAHPSSWYYAPQYPHHPHVPHYPPPSSQHPHTPYPHPIPQQSGAIPSIPQHVATPIYGAPPHAFRGHPPPQTQVSPHTSHVPAFVPSGAPASNTGNTSPPTYPPRSTAVKASVGPAAFDILDEEAPDLAVFFDAPEPQATAIPPAPNVDSGTSPSNPASAPPVPPNARTQPSTDPLKSNGAVEGAFIPAPPNPGQSNDEDSRLNDEGNGLEDEQLEGDTPSDGEGGETSGRGVRQRPSLANPIFGMVKGAGRGSRAGLFYRTREKKPVFTDTSKGCKYYNVAIHDLFTRCEDFSRRTRCWLHIAVQHPSSSTPFAHYSSQKLREGPEGAMEGLHGQASKVMANLLRAERKAKTDLQTELTEANETAKDATEKLAEAEAKLAKVNAFLAESGITLDDPTSPSA